MHLPFQFIFQPINIFSMYKQPVHTSQLYDFCEKYKLIKIKRMVKRQFYCVDTTLYEGL